MADITIDLDEPAVPREQPAIRRGSPLGRVAALLVFAVAAAAPQAAPALTSAGREIPMPSYCTGTPIPGGRLNIIHGSHYIILDAVTNTIVNEGYCPWLDNRPAS